MKRKAIVTLVLAIMVAAIALPMGFASAGTDVNYDLTGHWVGTYTSYATGNPVYGLEWDIVDSGELLGGSSVLTLPDGNYHIGVKATPGTDEDCVVTLTSAIVLHVLDPNFQLFPTDMEITTTNNLIATSETHMEGTAEMTIEWGVLFHGVMDDGEVVLDKVSSQVDAAGDLLGPWRGMVQSKNLAGTYAAYMNCTVDEGVHFTATPIVLENPEIKVTADSVTGDHDGNHVVLPISIVMQTNYLGEVQLNIALDGTYTHALPWDKLEGTYTIEFKWYFPEPFPVDNGTFWMKKYLVIAWPFTGK